MQCGRLKILCDVKCVCAVQSHVNVIHVAGVLAGWNISVLSSKVTLQPCLA